MAGSEVIGGFTTGELQLASFWVRNRTALRKALRIGLIVLSVLLYGYSAWGLLDAFVISYPRESQITRGIALNLQLLAGLETDRPQPVNAGETMVFTSTDNRIDMAATVENPNAQWWPEFNYRFTLDGEDAPLRTAYILPGSEQVLTELGYKPQTPGGGRDAVLDIQNVRWHRVDPKILAGGYESYRDERLDLGIENMRYDTDTVLGTKPVGRTSFTLVNKAAFGYWSVDLIVELMRGNQVAALTKLTVTDLTPAEHRDITITWVDNPPGVQNTEVIPQVNILEPGSFLPTKYFK